jgi:hypothetical protein
MRRIVARVVLLARTERRIRYTLFLPSRIPNSETLPMRTLCLVLVGVVVGWAASGVDWSRDAVGQEQIIDAARSALPTLSATTQPKLADPEPTPEWNNGANDQTIVTWPAPAARAAQIAPQPNLVGRFQATAYGSPSGHGCYIVDTMTGKTWHVAHGQQPQAVTEALNESTAQPTLVLPDAAPRRTELVPVPGAPIINVAPGSEPADSTPVSGL